MIEITSYLRAADGHFTQVEAATEAPRDPRYVEGAVELAIDGVQILDTTMWDYVDQLWAYISDMVLTFGDRGEASTYFPDQPIKLSFRRQGKSRVLVVLEINGDSRVSSIEEAELFEALRAHGSAFFARMAELLPENREGYDDAFIRLNQP
jgi:hypothetical protein